MPILKYKDQTPRVGERVYIAPNAYVIGDVELGDDVSVWFGTVVRGDVFHIRIGARTNLQDNSVLHVTTGVHPTIIGCDVTVGHRAILHGCTVHDGALVGMGATIMDEAIVGAGALIGAGALVTPKMEIPAGHLAVGSPARVKRPLTETEKQYIAMSGPHYVDIASNYQS